MRPQLQEAHKGNTNKQKKKSKEEIEVKKDTDQTKILCLLCSAIVTEGSNCVPPEENERLKSVFMTCFVEVHLSLSYSKIFIIPTPVSFFVLLIKSRVKNKNKIKKRNLQVLLKIVIYLAVNLFPCRVGKSKKIGPNSEPCLIKGNI